MQGWGLFCVPQRLRRVETEFGAPWDDVELTARVPGSRAHCNPPLHSRLENRAIQQVYTREGSLARLPGNKVKGPARGPTWTSCGDAKTASRHWTIFKGFCVHTHFPSFFAQPASKGSSQPDLEYRALSPDLEPPSPSLKRVTMRSVGARTADGQMGCGGRLLFSVASPLSDRSLLRHLD